jgi:hypothetical protein
VDLFTLLKRIALVEEVYINSDTLRDALCVHEVVFYSEGI